VRAVACGLVGSASARHDALQYIDMSPVHCVASRRQIASLVLGFPCRDLLGCHASASCQEQGEHADPARYWKWPRLDLAGLKASHASHVGLLYQSKRHSPKHTTPFHNRGNRERPIQSPARLELEELSLIGERGSVGLQRELVLGVLRTLCVLTRSLDGLWLRLLLAVTGQGYQLGLSLQNRQSVDYGPLSLGVCISLTSEINCSPRHFPFALLPHRSATTCRSRNAPSARPVFLPLRRSPRPLW
jgi:hypothetical protein